MRKYFVQSFWLYASSEKKNCVHFISYLRGLVNFFFKDYVLSYSWNYLLFRFEVHCIKKKEDVKKVILEVENTTSIAVH